MTERNDVGSDLTALVAAAERRILVLDGAMGTMIQRARADRSGLPRRRGSPSHRRDLKGNNDVLVLTRPDVIGDIHRQYLEAGGDIIETNTFSSQAISQADYDLESLVYELNVAGARLARAGCDEYTRQDPESAAVRGRLDRPDQPHAVDFARRQQSGLRARHVRPDERRVRDQVRGLIDGGVDLLLLETIFDTLNAKAALVAIEEVFEENGVRLPLMISVTITDRSGRTLSGQTLDAF